VSLADGYVKKSIDISELHGKIEAFLDKSNEAREAANNEET